MTDTSFWTAEPYLITQGAVPFVDNWSQTPLPSLLIAPFVRLFTAVTGGTEGIALFMFYTAFLLRLAVPLSVWPLLRRRMDSFWAGVFCLLSFVFDYGNNRYLNYNFMSLALLLLFLAASFALYSLGVQYAYVCRDGALPALTCRVERGVYRGLYTTPERAEALQNLEEQLDARVSPGEAVLFADLMPMVYLMTDGLPCTPTSWDPCHYRYGFQDDNLYQSYFQKTGRVPDKIFYAYRL